MINFIEDLYLKSLIARLILFKGYSFEKYKSRNFLFLRKKGAI